MWNDKQVDEEGDEGENAEGVDEDGGGTRSRTTKIPSLTSRRTSSRS